jgi:broad specificity phosphatase PhoE
MWSLGKGIWACRVSIGSTSRLPRVQHKRKKTMGTSCLVRALVLAVCVGAVFVCGAARPGVVAGQPQPTALLVVRHGEAYSNLPTPPSLSREQLDSLTPKGVTEAAAAGTLAKQYLVATVVTSPTGRTRQTAAIIAQEVGVAEGVAEDAAFASVKMGTMPDGTTTTWEWRVAEWQVGRDPQPVGGESLADAAGRAIRAVQALVTKHAGKAVVVVTHSDIVAALIGQAVGTPIEQRYAKHTVPTGAVREITVGADGIWKLVQ